VLPVLLLLIIPSFTWSGSAGGATASVGGDIPNTLFLNPGAFLSHLIGQHTGVGLTGSDTFLPYLSLALIAFVLKAVGLAPQLVTSGLVLAFTYLGVYVLAITVLPRRAPWMSHMSAAVGGSIAAVAPLIAQNFWADFEPRLYLLPLVPWLIYACIKFLRSGSARYLVAGALMTAAASAGIADIPGLIPVLLLIIMLVIVFVSHEHLVGWIYTRRLLIFVGVAALVNAYWLVPFGAGLLAGQAEAVSTTSSAGQAGALVLVAALAPYQQLSDLLALRESVPMMVAFTWSQLPLSSWYQFWWPVGFLPIGIAFGGFFTGLFGSRRREDSQIPLLALLVVSMVMLGFISLLFPPGAHEVFDFLIVHLPGWVAVKNFYETFAIPYVLAVALAACFGFYYLATIASRTVMTAVGLIVITLIGIYGAPLLTGAPYRSPYYSVSPANRVLSSLPSGYSAMVSRIVKSGGAPALSLPLLQPAWTYLVGDGSNGRAGTYIGIPPLYSLYGVQNYVGVSSFASTIAPDFSTNLESSITTGRADILARVVGMLGVRWVVTDLSVVHQVDFSTVNSQSTPAAALTFARAVEQNLHAVPVAREGNYALLRVPASFGSSVVSIDRATDFSLSSDGISQVAAGIYQGSLRNSCPSVTGGRSAKGVPEVSARIAHRVAAGSCFVALRVPYSTLWSATLVQNGRTIPLEHRQVYGFANGFVLPALSRGHVSITFSNRSSSFDALGAAISLPALLLLLFGPFVYARLRRRDGERKSLDELEVS
jgi:hypothetical protein